MSSGEWGDDWSNTKLFCGRCRRTWPQLDGVRVESHQRSGQPLEVLWIWCGRDVEILGCAPTSMHLRGNPTDYQIVHVMLSEHPKQLPEVQWALGSVVHDGT